MSLADRKKQAEKEIAQKNKLPNGTYQVRLCDWEFGQSQKKNDMYTIQVKVLKPIELTEELPEDMEEKDLKGKKRKLRFLVGKSYGLNPLLDILEQCGADLEAFDELSDIDTIFETIEDTKWPKATMTYEHEEGEQYPKVCQLSDVENVLSGDDSEDEEEAEEEEEEEAPAPAPKKKAKKKAVRAPGSK
jgi:hypothetical protein